MVAVNERRSESPSRGEKQLHQLTELQEQVVVFCKLCKTMETVWIDSDRNLIPTRKFHQTDGRVYHDCGAKEPCRIFRGW